MTVNELQYNLIDEVERLTSDMSLIDKSGKAVSMKGYPQSIPVFSVFENVPYDVPEIMDTCADESSLFPYFIVRISDVDYQKKEAEYRNQARVIIAFAVYDDDPNLKGYFTLTAIMERVIYRFQRNTVLGPFYCDLGMSAAFQEDDTYPQFFGALEMVWNLPEIEMEEWNGQKDDGLYGTDNQERAPVWHGISRGISPEGE